MSRAIDWSLAPAQFLKWGIVVVISAAPSFFIAVGLHPHPNQITAMLIGVILFIGAYTLVGCSRFMRRARRNKALRVTMRVGYGTRIAASLIFPIGLFLDVWVGFVSTAIVQGIVAGGLRNDGACGGGLVSRDAGFLTVLATTVLQGILLNIALLIFMAIVYAIARGFLPTRPPEGVCIQCGYDLRASADVCPECGEPIPASAARAVLLAATDPA